MKILDMELISATWTLLGLVILVTWLSRALLSVNRKYASLAKKFEEQDDYVHPNNCNDCGRKGQPSKRWGDKHVDALTWRARLESSPNDEGTMMKYRACESCGSAARRGRSPRGPRGRREEEIVFQRNQRVYRAGGMLAWRPYQ